MTDERSPIRLLVKRLDELGYINIPDEYDVDWAASLPTVYYDKDGELVYWRTDVPVRSLQMTNVVPDSCPNCGIDLDSKNVDQTTVEGHTTLMCAECSYDLTPDAKVNYKSPVEPDDT